MIARVAIAILLFPGFAAAQAAYRTERLAPDIYLFDAGFYSNIFIVSSEGVIATDPISRQVAPLLMQAIRRVTDLPVRYVIYSHDHSDHISGGGILSGTATFIAHENARTHILRRHNSDIVLPQVTFRNSYDLHLGDKWVRLLYFGPNHSDSTIGILLPREQILMLVDLVNPGSVPFRDFPGTNLEGLLTTLRAVKKLPFRTLVYGHGGAGNRAWIDNYISYIEDLMSAVREAESEVSYPMPSWNSAPSDPRLLLDSYIENVALKAIEKLRPKYGKWGGYDEWAVMNAQRVVVYLMMEG